MLRMLSTWLVPDSGTVTVAGTTRRRNRSARAARSGTCRSTTRSTRRCASTASSPSSDGCTGSRERASPSARRWVVEACQLGDVLATKVQHCSKGYRQRVGVAAALIHDPPVVLLDEPTHGLDPLQVALFLGVRARAREVARGALLDARPVGGGGGRGPAARDPPRTAAARFAGRRECASGQPRRSARSRTRSSSSCARRDAEQKPRSGAGAVSMTAAAASSERLGARLFRAGRADRGSARDRRDPSTPGIATIATVVLTLARELDLHERVLPDWARWT